MHFNRFLISTVGAVFVFLFSAGIGSMEEERRDGEAVSIDIEKGE